MLSLCYQTLQKEVNLLALTSAPFPTSWPRAPPAILLVPCGCRGTPGHSCSCIVAPSLLRLQGHLIQGRQDRSAPVLESGTSFYSLIARSLEMLQALVKQLCCVIAGVFGIILAFPSWLQGGWHSSRHHAQIQRRKEGKRPNQPRKDVHQEIKIFARSLSS